MQQQQRSNMVQVPFIEQGFNTGEPSRFMGTYPLIDHSRMTLAPTHNDVLLGRGVATNRHPGNENFRAIVSQHINDYMTSTKKQKMMISRSIVNKVHAKLAPQGRFLEKDPDNTCMWREVKDKRALEKTAQALRDGAAHMRKQLTKDMSDPAFMESIFDEKAAGVAKSFSTPMVVPSSKSGKKHRRTVSAVSDILSSSAESTIDMPALKKQKLYADSVGSSTYDAVEMDNLFMTGLMEPQSCSPQDQQHLYESMSQHHQVPFTNSKSRVRLQLGIYAASQPLQFAHDTTTAVTPSFDGNTKATEPIFHVFPPREVEHDQAKASSSLDDDHSNEKIMSISASPTSSTADCDDAAIALGEDEKGFEEFVREMGLDEHFFG